MSTPGSRPRGRGATKAGVKTVDGKHEWFKFHNLEACKYCGSVRRADDKNNPCRGIVNVRTR